MSVRYFILFLAIAMSCDSTDDLVLKTTKTDRAPSSIFKSTPCEPAVGVTDLLENGSFNSWDESHQPKSWIVSDYYNYKEMVSPEFTSGGTSLKMTRNCEGYHYIYQNINIKPFTYYVAKVKITGKIFDYSFGGLFVETNDGESLGHHLIARPDDKEVGVSDLLSVKFYSGDATHCRLMLGFINGMNAEVSFDDASLYEISSDATVACSNCYNRLTQYFKINPFNETNFDNNIKTIVGSLNYLFVDGVKKYYESGNIEWLSKSEVDRAFFVRIMHDCLSNTYTIDKLNEYVLETPYAYCQTISLATSEILSMFNISTRQVHFVDENGAGFHQFLEYWNPYLKKWITMDPFYGVYYSSNDELLGMDELQKIIASGGFDTGLINKIYVNEFYYSENDLILGWSSNFIIQLFKADRHTYP